MKKSEVHNNWMLKAAEEMDIELDDDLYPEVLLFSDGLIYLVMCLSVSSLTYSFIHLFVNLFVCLSILSLFFFFFFFLRSPAISLGFTTFWVRFFFAYVTVF